VTSMTHVGGRLQFDDLSAARSYNGLQRYMDSKLALVLAAKELQRRMDRCWLRRTNKRRQEGDGQILPPPPFPSQPAS
jgi:hypothetical protein